MTNKELYSRCVNLSRAIKKYRNKFIALLPEVAKRRLYLQHGMHSIYEFAAKLGYLSHDTVNRVLKVSEKLEEKPVLKSMFDSGEVGWSKLEVAVKLPIEEKEMAKILPTISKDALTLLAREAKSESGFAGEVEKVEKVSRKEKFIADLDPEVVAELRVFKRELERELRRPLSWEQAFVIMMGRAKNPVSAKTVVVKSKSKCGVKKTTSRYIPVAKKREVLARTKQLCAKCNKPAEHLHHEIPFSVSRSHESIVPLCKAHHDLVHHRGDNYVNRKYQEYKVRVASLAKDFLKYTALFRAKSRPLRW